MIHFRLENKKYLLDSNGSELSTEELCRYDHTIEDDKGVIRAGFGIGDRVYKHPDTFQKKEGLINHFDLHRIGTITSFTVFGGALCARFEGTNVPHSIDCLTLIGTVSKELFYVQKQGFVGNAMCWLRKESKGYTIDIREAQRYRLEDVPTKRTSDKVWPCSYIDNLYKAQRLIVDMQFCESKSVAASDLDSFIAEGKSFDDQLSI